MKHGTYPGLNYIQDYNNCLHALKKIMGTSKLCLYNLMAFVQIIRAMI